MKKQLLFLCMGLSFFTLLRAQNAPAADTLLQQYLGKYSFPEGSVVSEVTVTLDSGVLTMASTAGVSPLEKQSDDLFTIVQFQGTAKFNRDSTRKVIGVSIDAMGYQLEGKKQPDLMTRVYRQ
ncbi:MAG: hypothetical protein KGO92_15055, partial [Bacteroidota bacterium]|nr:hypothetical protein [Bacteroidota bacterium]